MTVLSKTNIWALWFEPLLLETLVEKGEAQEEATANHGLGVEERLGGRNQMINAKLSDSLQTCSVRYSCRCSLGKMEGGFCIIALL